MLKIAKSIALASITVSFIGGVLPSCAFKRFSADEQQSTESMAASAESLEEALAILDRAIVETEPDSEINSLPLDIPIHPEEPTVSLLEFAEEDEDLSISEDSDPTDTIFQIAGEDVAVEETPVVESSPQSEEVVEMIKETIPAESPEAAPRERIVVHRPGPSYSPDTTTTPAIDEFRKVRTTAYSHTEADHIKYGELSAMGKPLRFGMVRSAAADWSRYPVGTRFRIVGKPYEYVIDDYGSALAGTDTIDLYKPSDERMDNWGAQEVEIEIIAWGSFGKSLEILNRATSGDHIGLMIDAINNSRAETNTVADAGNAPTLDR